MDIGAVLTTAGSLMLTGMVGVFVFLSILIGAVTLMSHLVAHLMSRQMQPMQTEGYAQNL